MNRSFFFKTIEFVLLFYQFFNEYGEAKFGLTKVMVCDVDTEGLMFTQFNDSDCLPELSNEFVVRYYATHLQHFKDLPTQDEFIELMQHFCATIYKLSFTTSRLILQNI